MPTLPAARTESASTESSLAMSFSWADECEPTPPPPAPRANAERRPSTESTTSTCGSFVGPLNPKQRHRGGRGGKHRRENAKPSKPYAPKDVSAVKRDASFDASDHIAGLPLARSGASEVALLLEGIL